MFSLAKNACKLRVFAKNVQVKRYSASNKLISNCEPQKSSVLNTQNVKIDDDLIQEEKQLKKSVLETATNEEIENVAPYLKPTFNFAAYVNKSETLQELVKLGVDLHKLEKERNIPQFILGLDFKKDVQKYILLLNDLNVEDIGSFLTKNPRFLKNDIDSLVVRVNYLRFKRFSDEEITRIVSRNPFWLTYTTHDIDSRLGYFQKHFKLTGNEVRLLAVKEPRLITFNEQKIKVNTFAIKEEMGFVPEEIKTILLAKPSLFMKDQRNVLRTFEYLHNTMKLPLELIVKMPEILTCRDFRLKQRHLYLEKIGKAQFNPREPNYISPSNLVKGTDAEFCENVAKTSVDAYNIFLKTL